MENKKILTDKELDSVVGGRYCEYKVKAGDTLADIATHLGVTQSSLMALNGITNPEYIC